MTSRVYINHIDQVLPEIEGRKDFIHVVKDGYQVIDYVFEDNDTFSTDIRQQCRGIKFDLDGRIIGRPFHKFFNYGQKLLTYDWLKPHTIMTKMDGSMVHSCIINGELRLCTRMGLSEQAIAAESILTDRQKRYLKVLNQFGWNAILEYTAPDNRIVIEYFTPQLTLLACRNLVTGEYIMFGHAKAEFNNVETHQLSLSDQNIEQIRAETTGIEGYVVAWPDGTYVKIKGDEYTQMHRAVSYFERESMILPVVLDSQCDDLYPNLSQDRVDRLFKYEAQVMSEFTEMVIDVKSMAQSYHQFGWTRKDYALEVNANVAAGLRAAYFAAIDGKDVKEAVKACILRNPDLISVRW